MRERLQIPDGQDVLLTVSAYTDPSKKDEAYKIIDEVEGKEFNKFCQLIRLIFIDEGRQKLEFQPGILELMNYLDKKEIKHTIVTRNSPVSIDHFFDKLGKHNFGPVITR